MNIPVDRPHANTTAAWEKLDDRARAQVIAISKSTKAYVKGSADLGLLIRQMAATYAVRNPR
jgi:hypothetical protein